MTRFEWEVILRFLGAHPDEIKDVQRRMGPCVAMSGQR
jgi:hypothetical protein